MINILPKQLKPASVVITGSIGWTEATIVETLLAELAARRVSDRSLRVLTGMADGADAIARAWAADHDVELVAEPLNDGDYPGPMHEYNQMLLSLQPELVLAFKDELAPEWDQPGCIAGTEHMCRIAAEQSIPVLLNGCRWLRQP